MGSCKIKNKNKRRNPEMKKIIACLLAAAMMLTTFVGCGAQTETKTTNAAAETAAETVAAVAESNAETAAPK